MTDVFTQEIQVEDYPEFNPDTAEGQEDFNLLAVHMHHRKPWLMHFIFKRGSTVLGEVYITSDGQETIH